MNIRDILSLHYAEFLAMCTNTDIALYGGKTSEDLLGEAVITAINKYKDSEITEEEGYEYIKKTFLEACLFAFKKKCYDKEKMIEFIADYPNV